jgi:hypothetical protein
MPAKRHVDRARDAVALATGEASAQARKAERVWWSTQLAKLVANGDELHGAGTSYVSASQLLQLVEKRCGSTRGERA